MHVGFTTDSHTKSEGNVPIPIVTCGKRMEQNQTPTRKNIMFSVNLVRFIIGDIGDNETAG